MTTSPLTALPDDNNHRRDKVISVRFSADEYRGLQERALKAHMSLSDYIRTRIDYAPIMYRPTTQINTYSAGTTFMLTTQFHTP